MVPLDSLITLPWLCFWTEPIITSQHPQTCRLALSADRAAQLLNAEHSVPPAAPQPSACKATGTELFLALITPAAPHPSPLNCWHLFAQQSAVPFYFHSCGAIGKGILLLSRDPLTSLLAQWSGRGKWLSQIISSGAAPKCLLTMQCHCLQMQLVCLPLPGWGRPAHISMSMLCYWACRNVVFIGTDLLGGPKLAEILGRVS